MNYLIIAGLFRLMSLFSLQFLRMMGKSLGSLMWLLNGQTRRVTEKNLSLCFPDMDSEKRARLTKSSIQNLGMTVMEMGFVWYRPVEKLLTTITEVHGRECLDAAVAEGKGVLVLGPHIGNWELAGLYFGRNHTATIMFQPRKNRAFGKLIHYARQRSGGTLVPADRTGIKAQLRALKRNEVVAILPDQVPSLETGQFAPFFGVPALTAKMIASLANHTGARAIMAYTKRVPGTGEFHLMLEPVPEGFYSGDSLTALTALNQGVENCVKDAPEQYQWEYKRFRRQPGGERQYGR